MNRPGYEAIADYIVNTCADFEIPALILVRGACNSVQQWLTVLLQVFS